MTRFRTSLCDLLGIEYPILQSGMGGVAGPEQRYAGRTSHSPLSSHEGDENLVHIGNLSSELAGLSARRASGGLLPRMPFMSPSLSSSTRSRRRGSTRTATCSSTSERSETLRLQRSRNERPR